MGDPRSDLTHDLRYAGQNDFADRLGRLKTIAPASASPTQPSDALSAARTTTRRAGRTSRSSGE